MMIGIDHVESDMALNDFRHQPVYRAPARGDRVQDVRALGAFFQGSFDGVNLSFDAANPVQQFVLIANNVSQRKFLYSPIWMRRTLRRNNIPP